MKKLLFPNKKMGAPTDQGADFVELFFDLVFVYAITRITSLTAHHLDLTHVLQSVLIFWLIWWGWTQFTWALNAANTSIAEVRMMVLIATGVAFVMASSINTAFNAGVLWFAIPYVVIRIIGLILYLRVTTNITGQRDAVLKFALLSTTGLLAVIIGAFVSPEIRLVLWLAAIGLDMIAGYIGGRNEGWNLLPKHFAERHGLIVIIALGESLIVAASAVSNQERSMDLILVGGLAVLITCLLWWSYFSWINEHLEEHFAKRNGSIQARLARDAYSFMHFPVICGIIGIAIGFEKILQHPHDLLDMSVALTLWGGFVLFVGFTAASVWRTSKIILKQRIFILIIASIALVFSIGQPPQLALGIISVSLFLLTFAEWKKCKHSNS